MKNLLATSVFMLCAIVTPHPAFAITRALFYSGNSKAIISVQTPALGGKEKDAEHLFNLMKINPETAPDGVSKTITSPDGNLSVFCNHRIRTSVTCTITVIAGPQSAINERNGSVDYVLHDSPAQSLAKLFVTDANGITDYSTLDGMLRVESQSTEFRISFQQKNLPTQPNY